MRGTLRVSGFAILLFVLAGCATQSDHHATSLTKHTSNTLTAQEYTFARALVRNEIRREGAVVTSATVTVSSGKVIDSNIGEPCTSGRLLNIKLIGDFPHTVTTGHPVLPGDPTPDFTVHADVLTADAKTGRPCLVGVQTGKVAPDPGAESLPLN